MYQVFVIRSKVSESDTFSKPDKKKKTYGISDGSVEFTITHEWAPLLIQLPAVNLVCGGVREPAVKPRLRTPHRVV